VVLAGSSASPWLRSQSREGGPGRAVLDEQFFPLTRSSPRKFPVLFWFEKIADSKTQLFRSLANKLLKDILLALVSGALAVEEVISICRDFGSILSRERYRCPLTLNVRSISGFGCVQKSYKERFCPGS